MTERFRPRNGFTTIELIITILLLAIVSVVAYSRMPAISDYVVDSYCESLKSGVRRVQTQAMFDVASSGAYRVISSEHEVRWSNETLVLNDSEDCIGPMCSTLIRITQEDMNRGLQFNTASLEFDSFGRLVSAAESSVSFVLSTRNNQSKQVTVYSEGYVDGCD